MYDVTYVNFSNYLHGYSVYREVYPSCALSLIAVVSFG